MQEVHNRTPSAGSTAAAATDESTTVLIPPAPKVRDCRARSHRFFRMFQLATEETLWAALNSLPADSHVLGCPSKPCLLHLQVCNHPKKTFLSTRNSRRSTHVYLFWFFLLGNSSNITDDMLKSVRKLLRPVCPLGLNECNGHACTPGQQVCLNPFHYQLLDPQKIIDLLCKHQLLHTSLQVNTRRVAVAQFCQQLHAVLRSGHVAHNAAAFASIPSLSRARLAVPPSHHRPTVPPRLPSHPTTEMAAMTAAPACDPHPQALTTAPACDPHPQAVLSCSSAPNVAWLQYSSAGEGVPMAPMAPVWPVTSIAQSSWPTATTVYATTAHFGPVQYLCGPVPSHHQPLPPPPYPLQPHWQYHVMPDQAWQHALGPYEPRSCTAWPPSDAGDSTSPVVQHVRSAVESGWEGELAPAPVPIPVPVGALAMASESASVVPVREGSVSDSELGLMIVDDGADEGDDGADEGDDGADEGEFDDEEYDCDGDGDSESSDVSGARPNGDDDDMAMDEGRDQTGMQANEDSAPSCAAQPQVVRGGAQRYSTLLSVSQRCSPTHNIGILCCGPASGSKTASSSQPSLAPRATGWLGPHYRGSGHSSCSSASQSSRSQRGSSPARHRSTRSRSRSPSCYPQSAAANGYPQSAAANGYCAGGQPCAPPSAGSSGNCQAWPSTASQGSLPSGGAACPPLGPTASATYPDKIGSTSSSSCSPSPQVGNVTGASDGFVGLILLATAASRTTTNES